MSSLTSLEVTGCKFTVLRKVSYDAVPHDLAFGLEGSVLAVACQNAYVLERCEVKYCQLRLSQENISTS